MELTDKELGRTNLLCERDGAGGVPAGADGRLGLLLDQG